MLQKQQQEGAKQENIKKQRKEVRIQQRGRTAGDLMDAASEDNDESTSSRYLTESSVSKRATLGGGIQQQRTDCGEYDDEEGEHDDQLQAQTEDEAVDNESFQEQQGVKTVRTTKVCVLLEDENTGERLLASQIEVHVSECNEIAVSELIDNLCRNQFDFLVECFIFFYDFREGVYRYIGDEDHLVYSEEEVRAQKNLKLRFKHRTQEARKTSWQQQCSKALEDNYERQLREKAEQEDFVRRTVETARGRQLQRVKERTIEFALHSVREWRNAFENGILDDRGRRLKITLDQAACMVGMSRKTLDDYSLQLRKAREYGFDFDANLKQKIGVMRKFNKTKGLFLNDAHLSEIPQTQGPANCNADNSSQRQPLPFTSGGEKSERRDSRENFFENTRRTQSPDEVAGQMPGDGLRSLEDSNIFHALVISEPKTSLTGVQSNVQHSSNLWRAEATTDAQQWAERGLDARLCNSPVAAYTTRFNSYGDELYVSDGTHYFSSNVDWPQNRSIRRFENEDRQGGDVLAVLDGFFQKHDSSEDEYAAFSRRKRSDHDNYFD